MTEDVLKYVKAAVAGLAAIMFFLPLISFGMSGISVSMSGWNILSGGGAAYSQVPSGVVTRFISVFMLLVPVAICGLLCFYKKETASYLFRQCACGLILLIAFAISIQVNKEFAAAKAFGVKINLSVGWWLQLALYLGLVALAIYGESLRGKGPQFTLPGASSAPKPYFPAPHSPAPQTQAKRFCPQCGTEQAGDASFCGVCGASMK